MGKKWLHTMTIGFSFSDKNYKMCISRFKDAHISTQVYEIDNNRMHLNAACLLFLSKVPIQEYHLSKYSHKNP